MKNWKQGRAISSKNIPTMIILIYFAWLQHLIISQQSRSVYIWSWQNASPLAIKGYVTLSRVHQHTVTPCNTPWHYVIMKGLSWFVNHNTGMLSLTCILNKNHDSHRLYISYLLCFGGTSAFLGVVHHTLVMTGCPRCTGDELKPCH